MKNIQASARKPGTERYHDRRGAGGHLVRYLHRLPLRHRILRTEQCQRGTQACAAIHPRERLFGRPELPLNLDILQSDDKDPAWRRQHRCHRGLPHLPAQVHCGKIFDRSFCFRRSRLPLPRVSTSTPRTPPSLPKRLLVIGLTLKFRRAGLSRREPAVRQGMEPLRSGSAAPRQPCEHRLDPYYIISVAWGILSRPAACRLGSRAFNYKRREGQGIINNDTEGETWTRTSLMVDVGQMVSGKKNVSRRSGLRAVAQQVSATMTNRASRHRTPRCCNSSISFWSRSRLGRYPDIGLVAFRAAHRATMRPPGRRSRCGSAGPRPQPGWL